MPSRKPSNRSLEHEDACRSLMQLGMRLQQFETRLTCSSLVQASFATQQVDLRDVLLAWICARHKNTHLDRKCWHTASTSDLFALAERRRPLRAIVPLFDELNTTQLNPFGGYPWLFSTGEAHLSGPVGVLLPGYKITPTARLVTK